jgi:glycosyltransferase involved in cell wall biosynthesis
MISIVIPLYNKEKQIARTLNSVLQQTYQNFEAVIVNDGSTDKSVDEVKRFTDSRIRIVNQQNAGVSAARNRGIDEAKYDLIAFLDADDEWEPTYLETQYNLYLKYPECSVFACNYEFCDYTGKVSPTIIRKLPFRGTDGILNNYFEVASCSHPPIWSSSVMAKRVVLQSLFGFPVGIKSGEDLLTWARLAVQYKIAYYKLPLAVYNTGECYVKNNLPPRHQDIGDPVGKGLIILRKQNMKVKGLSSYISHWHKMRASVAMQYGERMETIKEIIISLRYNILNYKVIPIGILAILPKHITKKIIQSYK